MGQDDKSRESTLRRVAAEQHLKLSKSTRRSGGEKESAYELRDAEGKPVFGHDKQTGAHHFASLNEIESFLNDYVKNQFLRQARASIKDNGDD